MFTTKNKELAIFGNTITDLKEKWNELKGKIDERDGRLFGENGAFASLFSGKKINNILTPETLKQFDEFAEEFNHSQLSAEVLAEKMKNVDQRIIDYAKTCKNGKMSTEGFKASIDTMSLSAKAGQVALQALVMAGNMLIALGVSKAIELVAKAFDNYIHRVENANEATKQAIETFESVTSEVESLETKISEINQEINSLDPITDAQDIENLRLENEQLSTQLAILKEKQRVAGLEADKTAQDSLNIKQDSKYKFDTFTDSMGGAAVVATQVTKEEELLNAIEAHDIYKAKVDEANKALANMAQTGNYTQKEWDAQEKAIEKYSEGMLNARSHANELAIELNEQAQGLNGNTVNMNDILGILNNSIFYTLDNKLRY